MKYQGSYLAVMRIIDMYRVLPRWSHGLLELVQQHAGRGRGRGHGGEQGSDRLGHRTVPLRRLSKREMFPDPIGGKRPDIEK